MNWVVYCTLRVPCPVPYSSRNWAQFMIELLCLFSSTFISYSHLRLNEVL